MPAKLSARQRVTVANEPRYLPGKDYTTLTENADICGMDSAGYGPIRASLSNSASLSGVKLLKYHVTVPGLSN